MCVRRIDSFLQNLKHFLEYVHLPAEVQHLLHSMINHFAFVLTMFTKYQEVLAKLGVSGKPEDTESARTLGWLVFILGRTHILHRRNEVIECACLMIAVLTLVLPCSRAVPVPGPQSSAELRTLLCGIFKLKSTEPVDAMEVQVSAMLRKMEGETKGLGQAEWFDSTHVEASIRRLSGIYQQQLTGEELDERIFMAGGEARAATPPKFKFTPFARQGMANRIFTPAKPEDSGPAARKLRNSKRILNFDLPPATAKEGVTLGTKLSEIKFSQYTMQSPYTVNKLPAATPITRAMEMNNWLQDHVGKVSLFENGLTSTFNSMLPTGGDCARLILCTIDTAMNKISAALGIEKETEPCQLQQVHVRSREIRCMYFRIADELLALEARKIPAPLLVQVLSNPDFHRATLAAAAELVLFVHNSMAIRFEQILELCDVPAFEFWKLLRPLLKFDPVMPVPLKMHFQQIEIKILTSLAWQRNSSIHVLLGKIVEKERLEQSRHAIRIENTFSLEKDGLEQKATPMKDIVPKEESCPAIDSASVQLFAGEKERQAAEIGPAHEFFFQRVLHVVSAKIVAMAEVLGIGDEAGRERVWQLMKHCLSVETDLMIDRHLDQLLLCAIYAVGKMSSAKFSFNNIISHYIDLHSQASENVTSLFFNVKIDEHRTEDIIGFYNHIFILRVKSAVCSVCQPTPASTCSAAPIPATRPPVGLPSTAKHRIRALAPESPLTARMGSPMPMMTPRTKALYAFGESPCPGAHKPSFTPSLTGERKGTYKDSLRSQILLQQKPPAGICCAQCRYVGTRGGKPPKPTKTRTAGGEACSKNLFAGGEPRAGHGTPKFMDKP